MDSKYSGVYAEFAKIVGNKNTEKIYERFRGQQMCFPQKLYTVEYVVQYVKEHYPDERMGDIARIFGYSERRIRQLANKEKCVEKGDGN